MLHPWGILVLRRSTPMWLRGSKWLLINTQPSFPIAKLIDPVTTVNLAELTSPLNVGFQNSAIPNSKFGPNSPTRAGSSPSRKLQEVFQEAGARLDSANRLTSLVSNLEEEMQKSGVNVSFTKFANHLIQLQEIGSESLEKPEVEGYYVDVPSEPKLSQPIPNAQPKNWSSLFKAQAPSKTMKLVHYPDIHKGKEAHVEFDESQLDDGVGKHCLIGHFLDGKMPLPLLSATARAVWKDHGKFTVKQLGSCFLFEFEDEVSKLGVLEGGPYFFSRR